jgi:hypothetical protein
MLHYVQNSSPGDLDCTSGTIKISHVGITPFLNGAKNPPMKSDFCGIPPTGLDKEFDCSPYFKKDFTTSIATACNGKTHCHFPVTG